MALTTILPSGLNSANDFSSLVPSAFDQANSAASFANGAFITANASYASQNTTASFANGSFTKANSANVLAQQAFDKANTDATNISATAGVYGNASHVPVTTLTANGRVSLITNTAIAIDTAAITSGTLADARLPATGTAGTYGNTTYVPVITTDSKGRVTAVTNTAISFPVTSVAGVTGAVSNTQLLTIIF